tara:strand:+ start:215 stop:442 length:228 start_codon:yes stop_codon:yes gene_type:complete
MFYSLDLWKNKFVAKQYQKLPQQGLNFLGKREVLAIGGAGSWNENLWMDSSFPFHEIVEILIVFHDSKDAKKSYE